MKNDIRQMTEGNIAGSLVTFALPVMATNLFQQLYNTVDVAVVGRYAGTEALAAVGSAGQLTAFLIYFFIGLSIGAGIVISHSIGSRDWEKVNIQVHTALALAVTAGIALTVIGVWAAPLLLGLLNIPETVMTYAVPYIRIYFLGMLPMMLFNMGSSILRAAGDSRTGLYCLAAGGVVNVILDFLFVAGFSRGVRGAALATAAAQCVSAVLVLAKLTVSGAQYRLIPRRIHLNREECMKMIRVGVPAGLQSVLVSLSNVIVQSRVNLFGLETMAGFAAYLKLEGFLYMPIEAFGLAVSSFVGQNYGAGKRDRVEKGTRITLILSVTVTVVLGGVLLYFGREMIGIFDSSREVADHGMQIMQILIPFYSLYAVNQTLTGTLRGMGNSAAPMLISLFTMCGLRVVYVIVMLRTASDPRTIYVSYPLTWIVTTAALIICYRHTKKKKWSTFICS
ncbi:MATE family efflux transporter [Ruminococcus gauvreauii]|uniref:MATE family efflux transporter n=1 Tax=Ruminococcus gauvreauii TaxID=438033 RepID=A0ABY5VEV1_9FIRM|nr:MATE family efflux transporter [Ruminococcus gauvreauii]UWP58538.1 MATE family efflux transporter [Ruminococcus gauvreauii]